MIFNFFDINITILFDLKLLLGMMIERLERLMIVVNKFSCGLTFIFNIHTRLHDLKHAPTNAINNGHQRIN